MRHRLCDVATLVFIILLTAVVAAPVDNSSDNKAEHVNSNTTTNMMETEGPAFTTLAVSKVTPSAGSKPSVSLPMKKNSTTPVDDSSKKESAIEESSASENKDIKSLPVSSSNATSSANVTKPPITTVAPVETAAPESLTTLKPGDADVSQDMHEDDDTVEGDKAEEPVPGVVTAKSAPKPPADLPDEGKAREDLEPKEGGENVQHLVEEAKGNLPQQPQAPAMIEKPLSLEEPEESNFLSFILIAILLVACIYLLQHNKKRILGLMFEGRGSRRNVRYRRLSQKDDPEIIQEDIIY